MSTPSTPEASPRTRSTRRQKISDGVSKLFRRSSRVSAELESASSSTADISQDPSLSAEAQESLIDSTNIRPLNPQVTETPQSGRSGTTTPRVPQPPPSEEATKSSLSAPAPAPAPAAAVIPPALAPAFSHKPAAGSSAASKAKQPTASGRSTMPAVNANGIQQVTALKSAILRAREKLHKELRHTKDAAVAQGTTAEVLLDYIAAERLKRIPHQGSRYDRVLRYAEHFAGQISAFDLRVRDFVTSSNEAARLIWGSCLALLHLGHTNSYALERAFGIFYHLGLVLAFYLKNQSVFEQSVEVRQELGNSYADLLTLVTEVAAFYRRRHSDMQTASLTIDFDGLFGKTINSFYGRKDTVSSNVWTYQLRQSVDLDAFTVDIASIRGWLSPADSTVRRLANDPIGEKSYMEEYTCEWFQKPLLDFLRSRHQSMIVSGPPGSGKTVLSDWVKARLQRPIGRKIYSTISYDIDADILAESSSYSLVKDLLTQLLEQKIGDVALYKALVTVFELSAKSNNRDEVEAALWKALDTALSSTKNLIITVDGLNAGAITEAESVQMLEKLNAVVSRHPGIRLVILTRPLPKSPIVDPYLFKIDRAQTEVDIRHVVRAILTSRFGSADQDTQSKVIETTIQKSQGSFMNAILALQLYRGASLSDYSTKLSGVPLSIPDLIQNILNNLKSERSKLILSWMLVAQRPLTVKEVQALLEIDPSKGKVSDTVADVTAEIEKHCGPLVRISDGIVRFRHVSVRDALLKTVTPANAESDLTTRVLLYVKLHLTRPMQPSFDSVEVELIDNMFEKVPLLEYATRYWILHFRRSSMYKPNGDHLLSTEFKNALPNNALFPLLEGSLWEVESGARVAYELHVLTLTIRELTFGEANETTLQTLINIATITERLSIIEQTLDYYYRLTILSKTVLGVSSSVTYTCALRYLEVVQTVKITTKGKRSTENEEILVYLIDHHMQKGGKVDENVIKYRQVLSDLYRAIGEIALAASINKEIHQATVDRYGENSKQAVKSSESLTTVITKSDDKKGLIEYGELVFINAERNLRVTDTQRIDVTLSLAKAYDSSGDYLKAEEIYVTLWRRLIEATLKESTAANHQKKIEITLLYVRFLRRQNRLDEAAGILQGLWAEYEKQEITNETTIKQLQIVGKEMKSLGLITVALTIFSSVWRYFKKTNKHNSSEATETATLISETIPAAGTDADRYVDESVLHEVFERTSTKQVDTTTIKTSITITTTYMSKKKWSEAIKVCQQLLKKTWAELLENKGTTLPKQNTADQFELAIRIATCYHKEQKVTEAEKIYSYIFNASRANLSIQDKLVTDSATQLIAFYMETNQPSKAVGVYETLLKDYRTKLGTTDKLTITTLYTLARLCQKHRIGHPDNYYLEIVQSLNKGAEILVIDSMEAATYLGGYYYDTHQWKHAQNIYTLLWNTFKSRSKEYNITAEFAQTIYERYIHILETHTKVEYSTIYQITVEYRETCVKVYGATADITIHAALTLAQVCERDEKLQQEAITIYEEVLTKTTTTTKSTTITKILNSAKQRLAGLYIKNASTSKENAEKAVSLYGDQFRNTRETHGSSHELTLISLRDMVYLWTKQKTKELDSAAEKEIKATLIDVVTKETDSRRLFDAAISIATTYVSSGLTEQGWAVLWELRRQVVYKDYTNASSFGFKIDQKSSRRVYVFIAAFEETLNHKKTLDFSLVMASLLTEIFLYERYSDSLRKQSDLALLLNDCARLRTFLIERNRQTEASKIEDEVFEIFIKGIGAGIKTPRPVTRTFFIILLEELGRDDHDTHLGNAACLAGNERIYKLLEAAKFQDAFELATCVFQFVKPHRGYHHSHNIGNGFKLSLHMAGRGAKKPADKKLQDQMLALSRAILRETLDACKHLHINFVQMKTSELNNLVGLMGDQDNFDDLEWLLTELWEARHSTSWSATTVVWIGRRLVEARFAHGNHDSAIRLCEDICYNLRRVWGALDPTTVQFNNLLSTLYTSAGRHRQAMAVHEDLLRQEVGDDNEDPVTPSAAARAMDQLQRLRVSYQRNGGWDGSKEVEGYAELVRLLKDVFEKEDGWAQVQQDISKWEIKGVEGDAGLFVKPATWEFEGSRAEDSKHVNVLKRRSGSGAWSVLNAAAATAKTTNTNGAAVAGKEQAPSAAVPGKEKVPPAAIAAVKAA